MFAYYYLLQSERYRRQAIALEDRLDYPALHHLYLRLAAAAVDAYQAFLAAASHLPVN